MRGIKYVAPVFDPSGYGLASRSYIRALHKKGVPLVVEPHCFEYNSVSMRSQEEKDTLNSLMTSDVDYDIVISQLTPDMAATHVEAGKYNIFYFAWESTALHPEWVECLQKADEIFVPCRWNKESLESCGITKPVTVVPHGIDPDHFKGVDPDSITISGVPDNAYVFYNIFQWQPRKNPDSMLRAYFNAFTKDDNVVLLMKSYVSRGDAGEAKFIQEQVYNVKKDMGLSSYPKLLLIVNKLPDDQVAALHLKCDCLVSLHRSEGWGLVPFEAGLAGNPVIATGATGNMEFMTKQNSYPVDYQWQYVREMSSFNKWYLGCGKWASPSEPHAADLMRYVYEHKEEAREMGSFLRATIINDYSWDKVSDIMLDRLNCI